MEITHGIETSWNVFLSLLNDSTVTIISFIMHDRITRYYTTLKGSIYAQYLCSKTLENVYTKPPIRGLMQQETHNKKGDK